MLGAAALIHVSVVKFIVCSLPSLPFECAKLCISPVSQVHPSKLNFIFGYRNIVIQEKLASLFKSNHHHYVCVCKHMCETFYYHGATSIYENLMSFSAPQYACRTWTICVNGLTLYFMLKIEANSRYILCFFVDN